MKVVLAEKPSVARDLAAALNITGRKNGYIEGRGCAVTWAFGHLVGLQEPGEYDPNLKRWRLDTLPFIPEEFRLKVIGDRGAEEQFNTVRELFRQAEEIVCATDAGREGELIFRYILALSECENKPFRRLWLNSLTPDAIKEAFANLNDGRRYDPLYAAARCRSEADWIVGLNATRCFTVRHGRIAQSDDRVLWSIGRVQTPVLAMITERDDEIRNFTPRPFFELQTVYRETLFKHTGDRFDQPEQAQEILEKINGQPFTVTKISGRKKTEQPPQLFDLTTLQRELNKRHGISAADTLEAAQFLYENKLITYPRTDSRYLSSDMKPRLPKIMQQLKTAFPAEIEPLNPAKLPAGKRIIDDGKVTDHHAIIPTGQQPRNLTPHQQMVYEAVCIQFIAAFYPPCEKKLTTVDGVSEKIEFRAKGSLILKPGWTALFPKKKKQNDEDNEEEDDNDQTLPEFKENESGPHEPSLREGKTKPPAAFNENSLLGAMEAAGKRVDDDALRESLKERGIGTPATRAAIIETLLRRNYIRREKKKLLATDMGRCLIALIQDPLLKSPEMTGEWELRLKQIERGELDPDEFMRHIGEYTRELIRDSAAARLDSSHWGPCPLCGKPVVKGREALGCSGWREGCRFVLKPEYRGLPLDTRRLQELLQRHISPRPVRFPDSDEPRLLLLTKQGFISDIRLPDAGRQKKKKADRQKK